MRLVEIMRPNPKIVTPQSTIGEALRLLRENRIRHLPVIEHGKLVGIVSDRDLRDALPSSLLHLEDEEMVLARPVTEIMKHEVITGHPLDFLEDAAKTVYMHKIGCLPIVEGDELVGIITESDIFHNLVELFGVNRPSSQIEVEVDDRVGMLAEVSNVFRDAQTNVTSVIVYPCRVPTRKLLVFRVQTIDPRNVLQLLKERGFHVVAPIDEGGPLS